LVNFNCTASGVSSSGSLLHAALQNNNNTVDSAQSAVYSDSSSDIVNIGFTSVIVVRPSCQAVDNTAHLSVEFLDVSANIYLANIIVTRV
jgi:ligand-binding sensor domain-containing protein